MATFNGARWLSPQLESIALQSRLPDQILVYDDASTDETLDVVRAFSRRHPGLVHIARRTRRIGATANFSCAIEDIPDGVILLSDQDDVWRHDRIECSLRHLSTADAVFSDAKLSDEAGSWSGRTLWDTIDFSPRRLARWDRDPLAVLLQGNVVTGATLAFRRTSLEPFLPLPKSGWHDFAIAVFLAASGRIVAEPDPLVTYRLHQSNTAGLPARRLVDRRRSRFEHAKSLDQVINQLAELENALSRPGYGFAAERISDKRDHMERRRALLTNQRTSLLRVGRELLWGHYHRFGRGLANAAQDLLSR